MPGPVRQSNLVVQGSVTPAALTGATITGVASGNTLVSIVVAYYPTAADTNICTGYGTTIGGSAANTWSNVLRVRSAVFDGVWYAELTAWIASNVSAGDTVGKPTFAASTEHWVFTHMDEWSGIVTSSPVDQTATAVVAAAAGTASVTVGPTSTLSQASEVVIAAVGNRYNYVWNSGYGSGTAPSTYTVLRGTTDNTTGAVGQSAYKEVTATTAVSATWTFADGYGPTVAGLFTLKQGTTALRLEVDDIDTEITGTTGWTFWAWSGDPLDAKADKRWTAYSATLSGGKLVFPDAPPGATDGSTWNVIGYQPSGTLTTGFMTGTVRAV
jgi:hypothetical protein